MNLFLRFLTEKTSQKTDVYYIDSTFLEVCKNQRIYRHKTFKGLAARGVSSCGWFYGFKLHLITNHLGEIVSFAITFCEKARNTSNHKLLRFEAPPLKPRYLILHNRPYVSTRCRKSSWFEAIFQTSFFSHSLLTH